MIIIPMQQRRRNTDRCHVPNKERETARHQHCVPGSAAAYYVEDYFTLGRFTMLARVFGSGLVLALLLSTTPSLALAESSGTGTALKGDTTRGQGLFNGKGICHYCHGIDGVIDKKPSLTPDTAAAIAKHAASAPDLRNRATQSLKDNKARFRAIREGHPGSGMFPDTTLSDQDIADLLAYLASLRQSQTAPHKNPY